MFNAKYTSKIITLIQPEYKFFFLFPLNKKAYTKDIPIRARLKIKVTIDG